jgi:hypothetical protein
MRTQLKLIGLFVPTLVLGGCSSEPRTVPYFEKNVEEARAVVADTDKCMGLDPSKAFTGADECTNAHMAVNSANAKANNQKIREGNLRVIKECRMFPTIKK